MPRLRKNNRSCGLTTRRRVELMVKSLCFQTRLEKRWTVGRMYRVNVTSRLKAV